MVALILDLAVTEPPTLHPILGGMQHLLRGGEYHAGSVVLEMRGDPQSEEFVSRPLDAACEQQNIAFDLHRLPELGSHEHGSLE